MNNNHYVAIMAGGIGSRFWPISRTSYPKQFLDILNTGRTLIQATHDRFKKFIQEEIQTTVTDKHEKIDKIAKPVLSEAAWVQFLFILKFWVEDTSIGFEKTDIMIEKSVKATFDILDTTPLESLFDLGKFVWKERFN